MACGRKWNGKGLTSPVRIWRVTNFCVRPTVVAVTEHLAVVDSCLALLGHC